MVNNGAIRGPSCVIRQALFQRGLAMKKILLFLCILSFIPSFALIAEVVPDSQKFQAAREKLVKYDIEGQGISDSNVLAAMRSVPRHCFVPEQIVSSA